MKQRIAVLGSTGSIGVNTLDVIARHPDRFEVAALSAGSRVEPLLAQCVAFRPAVAVMADPGAARELAARLDAEGLRTRVLAGAAALEQLVAGEGVDTVMAAIVGAAGLGSCLAAARAGKRLLLANKEALVVGGELFLDAVATGGATLLPIDSEHSAIFQSLPEDPATWADRVDRIILTASGGPFRDRAPETLRDVTPEQACAHPNWVMGRKISVDSATMMNKALEVIEARYLFGLPPERLQVVIHPQSVIHSMVQYRDNSVVAQLGTPDMRVPIAYGLAWPERITSGAAALDFSALADMSFESFDSRRHRERFPGLQLAWDALAAAPGTTAVLNAANEEAVAAFLDRRIRFDQIHAVNLATLDALVPSKPKALADLLAIDAQAREAALRAIGRLA
ncbi:MULTISPECIES: 1-deoxy-D-xylulose-5-phosphate reductoisomerase [Ramlibacter]|uniref:1-deoxy-D-xylulose 5-phosphate reductoisomerase n=1 Tax=Ramlibacter pinisoli TaxID=2682844 RepID=A0A6N8IXF7_9BURK|nr:MULTISPECIES: 1-deoxy-D-xylulose-5-phosphate reductoisomerase [Ramlibacter]MBA2961311.1 1-deoxy-D-xylulose-5-phosphate reductoisomerase [Ramlibacter sp. CGMCC 1.13660]MVQ31255.1 1-deoxy-D-xylulose-5-phosphate reductoisomerase [Ramlibacter pinisoli]